MRFPGVVLALLIVGALPARAADETAIKHGEILFAAADCAGCHTDAKGGGQRLAGGRPLQTPFGLFFSPNITPDRQFGIGGWSEADFRRALREGIGREGEHLFPVFPYPSFTGMSDGDIADLYDYLQAQPAVAAANKPNQVEPPFRWRFLQVFWRWLFFTEGPLQPVPAQSAEWNRGRYLAEAVAHCGECHTPRNFLGGLRRSRAYSGDPAGPDGQKTPNITPDPETGIGKWSLDDIATLLKTGQTPDFDFVGSGMAEAVKGLAALSDADRRAIAVYVKSLPPVRAAKKAPAS
jgi:mono/diheme cytochrome c family protein